ncbi:MAG: SGNH/GDSL hydrolase family protein [Parvularculaceae bacterium]
MKRAPLIGLAIAYLAALHATLVATMLWPDWIEGERWRFGARPAEPASYAARLHAYYQAVDASAAPGRVVLLGDSHFQRMDVGLIGLPALNFGIGGARVSEIAERMRDYRSIIAARAVIVWGGVNDLLAKQTPEQTAADMAALLEGVRGPKLVLLVSVPPPGKALGPGLARRVADLNARYAAICESSHACFYVDIHHRLAAPDGALAAAFDAGDHLHLNRAAYGEVATVLKDAIGEREQ